MRIVIDSDCNGHELKHALMAHLDNTGHEVVDLHFTDGKCECHYPDVALNLARKIQTGEFTKGILICGTGLGMAITANKVPGVYAGACSDIYSAERLAKSNNAQIIALGAQVTGIESAKLLVQTFVSSEFGGGRSLPKYTRIQEIEKEVTS